jgi:aldose 1-epimerase
VLPVFAAFARIGARGLPNAVHFGVLHSRPMKPSLALPILLAYSSLAFASVTVSPWGKTVTGQPVELYTLADGDLTVRLTNYGAHVVSIEAPDRNGHRADVALGHKDVSGYENDKTYMGSIVGRYGNRIAHGTFSLDGATYHVPTNDHGNSLHGGTAGFDQKVWTGHQISNGVEFTLVSPDGDMGFPGQLTAHVRYTLEGNALHIDYTATTTKPTVLNLTNHTYFNLAGEGSGDVLKQVVMLNADRFTPVNAQLIPTGQIAPVAGTGLDFRKPTPIGAHINDANEQIKRAGGFDHNFVLNGSGEGMHLAARVVDPASGRTLTVTTTQPGVQFYSGNFLDGTSLSPSGKPYNKHAGFCLETQHFPDSPNQPSFPSTVLRQDRDYLGGSIGPITG